MHAYAAFADARAFQAAQGYPAEQYAQQPRGAYFDAAPRLARALPQRIDTHYHAQVIWDAAGSASSEQDAWAAYAANGGASSSMMPYLDNSHHVHSPVEMQSPSFDAAPDFAPHWAAQPAEHAQFGFPAQAYAHAHSTGNGNEAAQLDAPSSYPYDVHQTFAIDQHIHPHPAPKAEPAYTPDYTYAPYAPAALPMLTPDGRYAPEYDAYDPYAYADADLLSPLSDGAVKLEDRDAFAFPPHAPVHAARSYTLEAAITPVRRPDKRASSVPAAYAAQDARASPSNASSYASLSPMPASSSLSSSLSPAPAPSSSSLSPAPRPDPARTHSLPTPADPPRRGRPRKKPAADTGAPPQLSLDELPLPDREGKPGQALFRLTATGGPKDAPKKKPVMACLFCRERKIACGPPAPGSGETRCNQCARRSLRCEYPKESRRGQHKRGPRAARVQALADAADRAVPPPGPVPHVVEPAGRDVPMDVEWAPINSAV